ncbi:uncharacterized protein LOC141850187 isoform X2 [Brevipalpus obovatus]|uniref:uncharacterized protein LOC141850187 isoform X2 n=1 Tax=Brevipalpus obovatus TaxID=246614 RepID=UPI003D9EC4E1
MNVSNAVTLDQERVRELCREARILEKNGKKADQIIKTMMNDDALGLHSRNSKDRLLMKVLLEKLLANKMDTRLGKFDGPGELVIKEKIKNKEGSSSDVVNFFGLDSGQIESNGGIQEVQSDDKVINSRLSKSLVLKSVDVTKSSQDEASKKVESTSGANTQWNSSNGSIREETEEKEIFHQNRIKKCDAIILTSRMKSEMPERWMNSVAFIEKTIE